MLLKILFTQDSEVDMDIESIQNTDTASEILGKECRRKKPWPRGYKTFVMLNSVEHEIFPANKC